MGKIISYSLFAALFAKCQIWLQPKDLKVKLTTILAIANVWYLDLAIPILRRRCAALVCTTLFHYSCLISPLLQIICPFVRITAAVTQLIRKWGNLFGLSSMRPFVYTTANIQYMKIQTHRAYILKVKKSADSTFQSKEICGKSA